MSSSSTDTLLSRWNEARRSGQPLTPEELCRDQPHLLEQLRQEIAALEGVAPLVASAVVDGQPTASLGGETIAPTGPADGLADAPRLDRYEVEGLLGRGGMGAVYRARDRLLGRTVALKVIRAESLTTALRRRFEDEARAVARLDHPHIIKIFDVGEWRPADGDAVPYLALEFVPGGSLGQRLCEGPMPPAAAARLVQSLAGAVAHAHERGVVHRDLKPENVLLSFSRDPQGSASAALPCGSRLNDAVPKITDFGLARQVEADRRLTQSGAVVGTPAYMAPEQAQGTAAGPPADVWALGVMLYQLLAGRLPFAAPSAVDLFYRVCHEPPPPLSAAVPPSLQRVCLACLEKAADQRPSAAELARRLQRWQAGEVDDTTALPGAVSRYGLSRRRLLLLGLGAGVPLAGGLAWLALSRWQRQPPPPADEPHVRIRLRVRHYATAGQEAEDRGLIGEQSFAARYGDAVTPAVELSEPAYFYLIGFNFDGKEQLLWPADDDGQATADVPPPRLQRLRQLPGDVKVHLDDTERGGLQVFAVVAARAPLPAYTAWRAARGDVGWLALPAGETVWEADAQGAYAMLKGVGADRGSVKELPGTPPLRRLCRALQVGGVEAVEVVAFPVRPRESGK